MKQINVILVLVVALLISLSNSCFAQNQNKERQINPERLIRFLDKNDDQKISKKEASRAKRLADNFDYLDTNRDDLLTLEELKIYNSSSRYTYLEGDGICMYYETEGIELYRELLPKEFDMPDRLLVYIFISDFYKMDEQTQPYKESSIFLLGKYQGEKIWHCVYMPVTSEESMRMGIIRLGLPKTMGEIEFNRSETFYSATLVDENENTISLSIDTKDYSFDEEKVLKELSLIPKMNLLRGKVIEMGKKGNGDDSGERNRSIFDIARLFPNHLIIKGGAGEINFNISSAQKSTNTVSPLDLKPTKIIGAYYMQNKIPYQLGKK